MSDKNVVKPLQLLFVLLFEFVMLAVCISVLIWTCLRPKFPVYTITNVYIPALDARNSTFHQHNITENTSKIMLSFELSNPNKGTAIYFDSNFVTVYFQDSIIGNKSLPGFYQGYQEMTPLRVQVDPVSQGFFNGTAGGTVRVLLRTTVEYRYKIFGTMKKHHQLDFEADVPIGSDGRLSPGKVNVTLEHGNKFPAGQ